jgi:hypothetical protein
LPPAAVGVTLLLWSSALVSIRRRAPMQEGTSV